MERRYAVSIYKKFAWGRETSIRLGGILLSVVFSNDIVELYFENIELICFPMYSNQTCSLEAV